MDAESGLFPSDDPKETAQYTIWQINHCTAFVIVSKAIVPDFDTLDDVEQFPGFASEVSLAVYITLSGLERELRQPE
jgi:hypothetical protein